MAARHDIVHIEFQANAGKANAALDALRAEAARTKTEVDGLTRELARAKNAHLPIADIQNLEAELKKAKAEHRQWQSALNNNLKGVRALDEAIKTFNKGKGSVADMNVALSKTARNAAQLQKDRSKEGSKTWNEMSALIKALDANMLNANTALNQLTSNIKNGGATSKAVLTQAKTDLQQLIALENEGSNAWKKYTSQLKVVDGALTKMAVEQQQVAGKNVLAQVFRGDYITKSRTELEQMIAKLREYQGVIADPEGKGARHFQATQTAITKLSERLQTLKVDAGAVKQALQVAGAAGVANKFGSDLAAQQSKLARAYGETAAKLAQLKQQRETYTILQQNGITLTAQEQAMLARLDAQIASTTTQLANERNAMIQAGDAQQLNTQQIEQSIAVLRQQQATVAEGSPSWKKYESAITTLDERLKIMRGEAMSLTDALKIAGTAGGKGFSGTAQQLQQAEQALQKAASTAKKGSSEWQKYQQALAKVRVEMQNTGMTSERMHKILERPANAKNLQELSAAVKRAKAELDLMTGTIGQNSKAYKQLAEQTKQAEIQLKTLQGQARGTATAFSKAVSRLKTYISLYVGAAVAMQKIMSTFSDLMELSDKMGEVRKTTGLTAEEVGRLSTNLKKLDTRTALTGLMELSVAAGQLGLKTQQDVLGFTEAANKLMVALPEMGKDGATQMLKVALATGEIAKIQEQMNQGLINGSSAVAVAMEKVGSTIDQLRANSAAAAPAITDFVKRVGAVGAQSGISIDQVAALGSTVDALGMRVEMSATALSRMIPAIRNNAFAVAKAIKVEPNVLRNLFDTGRGMEAILMIFQHIKDAGMDSDSIESMLGMGNMKEVMKELNQMGARAGIVFSGLSQNVDELRRQLGVAANAYEENIAIQNEYNKMNETTAAKWERLKNEVEEFFIGDKSQKVLGAIIDQLRAIVNILTGSVSPALDFIGILLKTIIIRWALIKAGIGEALLITLPRALKTFAATATMAFTTIGTQVKALAFQMGIVTMSTKRAAVEMRKMNAGQMANFWVALALAITYAAKALYDWYQRIDKTVQAMAEAEANLASTTREVGNLFSRYKQLGEKQEQMSRSAKSLKEQEEKLKNELEDLRKKLGEGAEQTEAYKKKQEELEEAHKKVATAEEESAKATNKRSALISEINSKYSTYLGYMLSEASTAETVASAHDLIIAALKEEMYWREKNKAFETVTQQHEDDLRSFRESSMAEMNGIDAMRQQNIMSAWQGQLSSVQYDASRGGFIIPGADKAFESIEDAMTVMKDRFNSVLTTEGGYYMLNPNDKKSRLNDWWGESGAGGWGSWTRWTDRGFKDWTRESLEVLKEASMLQSMAGGAATKAHEAAVRQAQANTDALIAQAQQGDGGKVNNKQLAEAIVGISKNLSKYGELSTNYSQFGGDNSLENIGKVLLKDVPEATRKAVMADAQRIAANGITPPKPTKPTSSWGGTLGSDSTDWKNMNAEELVARRKQMKEFVNAIQTDTDVKKVLAEDAALMKAFKGREASMREVVEWYNTERLKIQDELYSRHLTNTGDWKDPKKSKESWRKQLRNDFDTYLRILDAYYTERKAKIEKAQSEEGMSEAEAQRLTIENETVWRKHRMELQQIYQGKTVESAQRIYDILAEQDEDTADMVEKTIAKSIEKMKVLATKDEVGFHGIMSRITKGIANDLYKQQHAVANQVEAIRKIISQERPFDGLVENLEKNLSTMGILFAELDKMRKEAIAAGKEPEDDTNLRGEDEARKRMLVLMQQAENAYTLTFDKLKDTMIKEGFADWADAIEGDDQLRNAMMAMLRKMYDDVHAAIKKESSQMKKELDIWWNDVEGEGKLSRKGGFEKMLSDLGLQEDQVKRANQLIGAGAASERVADKLAIQQMRVRLAMQNAYYAKLREIGNLRIKQLEIEEKQARKRNETEKADLLALDIKHAKQALNLSLSEEQNKVLEQEVAIQNKLEESQNRLYTELKAWGDLLASSLKDVMEASHAGDADYYNERAKLNLTGKGGPGAGTYIVIDNEGTSDATAHYEYLDERQALERQHEIEQQNAQAEAWRKVMDDLNNKMSEQITDWMNAALQNASIDANTAAILANTEALYKTAGMDDAGTSTSIEQERKVFGHDESLRRLGMPLDDDDTSAVVVAPVAKQPAGESGQVVNIVNNTTNTAAAAPVAGVVTETEDGGTLSVESGQTTQMFPMTDADVVKAQENIQLLWQTYVEQGATAMVQLAEQLGGIPNVVLPPWQLPDGGLEGAIERMQLLWEAYAESGIEAMQLMSDAMGEMENLPPDITRLTEEGVEAATEGANTLFQNQAQAQIDASGQATDKIVSDNKKQEQSTKQTEKQKTQATQSSFAKMTQAANMYGLAYQVMSNDNLDATQKFLTFALQSAGQTAIAMLTTDMVKTEGESAVKLPGIFGSAVEQLGPIAGPIAFAAMTALLGGLMAVAMSKVTKSKSQISQVTGASSASAGRLSTGMMTYAEGNVNEFTDPNSLTPGRTYNVDAADGRTYRAKYTGRNPKTHLTNGPEFHLSGERGREMIIDAGTTRQITMNDTDIWKAIQTLSGGGSLRRSTSSRRGRGMSAFADGNLDDFEEMAGTGGMMSDTGMSLEMMAGFQSSLDRNNQLLERALNDGILARNIWHGPEGIPNMYNKMQKEAQRHGEKYL